jgi:hypothetical protein
LILIEISHADLFRSRFHALWVFRPTTVGP